MQLDPHTLSLTPDLRELDDLLAACADPDNVMTLGQLDGFLSGIMVSPHKIAQATWLCEIWHGEAHAFPGDPLRSERLIALILARKAHIESEFRVGGLAHRPLYDVDDDTDQILWENWINGFAVAMAAGGKDWDRLLETRDEDLVAAFLGLLRYVASVRGLDIGDPVLEGEEPPPEVLIPYFAETMFRRQHGLKRVVMGSDDDRTPVRVAKIGRNDPCLCGSGKKYKKCCLIA